MIAQMLVDQRADRSSIQQPSFIDIPLYHCLSLDSRDLIDHGAREGSRNDSGAKLARDLIGTAAYLDSIGQPYEGDSETIFMAWCRQVKLDKDKPSRQPESIWRSAQQSNPKPCLSPDKIDNCISAWERKQKQCKPEQPQPVQSKNRHSGNSDDKTQRLTPDQLIDRVSEIRKLSDGVKQWFAWSELIKASGYSKRELMELQIAVETRSIFEPCEGLNFIANTPDQFEYLVDSLIVLGVNILIYADSGIGKSLLLYDIGKAVATGSYWSGFKAAEGIVLIIQTDEPSAVTKRRLKRMGFHKTQAGRWYVEQNWQFGQLQQLEGWIVEYQPKLIMIDCLATSNRSARTDENELAYALVQNDLMKLADRYHCTIVTLHHENKIGQARGSTGLPAHVSEVWQLRNPDSQEVKKHQLTDLHRILVIKKSRTNFVGKHLLELEPESYQWLYKGELTDELTSPPEGQETARALILRFLKEQSQLTYYSPEAISQTIGKSEHTVRKECSKLFDQGVLDRNSKSSAGEKGRPFTLYRYKHFSQEEVSPDQPWIKNQNPDPVSNSNFDPHSKKDTPFTRKDSANNLEGEY